MTVLADNELMTMLKQSRLDRGPEALVIENFDCASLCPTGYYLRVGRTVYIGDEEHKLSDNQPISIPAKASAIILTYEYIAMPTSGMYVGFLKSKVNILGTGAAPFSTVIDHDWSGHLKLVVHNTTSSNIVLACGDPVCRLVIQHLSSKPNSNSEKNEEGLQRIVRDFQRKEREQQRQRRYRMMWGGGTILAGGLMGVASAASGYSVSPIISTVSVGLGIGTAVAAFLWNAR